MNSGMKACLMRNKEIADGVAGSKYIVVPDCAHLSTLEKPEAVKWIDPIHKE